MKKDNNFLSAFSQTGCRLKLSFKYLFSFLFVFLFAYQQTYANALCPEVLRNGVVFLENNGQYKHKHPYQLPVNPASTPQNENAVDENEFDEDTDDINSLATANLSFKIGFTGSLTGQRILAGVPAEHYMPVPLFVLHHSWKSYLS